MIGCKQFSSNSANGLGPDLGLFLLSCGFIAKDTPIVAVTSHAMCGDREKFLRQGMNDYISKPINVSNVLATVDKYCRKTSRNREKVACIN